MLEMGEYTYSVTAEGYKSAEDVSFSVSGMKEIAVELEKNLEITVNNVGKEKSRVTVTVPENGWVEGTNSFIVTGEDACVAAVSYDGGKTYTRLSATEAEEGGYIFTAENMTADTIIAVAVVGDVNGDGMISTIDTIKVKAAALGVGELDGLSMLTADVNGDGRLSTIDSVKVKAAALGRISLDW